MAPAAMRPKYLGTPAMWTGPFGIRAHNQSLPTIILEIMHGQVGFDSDSRRCKLPAAVGECQSQLRQYQWFCLHRADVDNPLVTKLNAGVADRCSIVS